MWVAAVGHLYGPNPERGVFMTTDGGKTWTKTLYINQDTGATDLVIDPTNPNNLWAAMYERRRTAWGFVGGGPGSGIHQSTDGGKTWTKVTGNGLPRGTLGRIALDICKIAAERDLRADRSGARQGNRRDLDQPAAAAAGRRAGRRRAAAGARRRRRRWRWRRRPRRRRAAPPDPQVNGIWRSTDKGKTWTFMSQREPAADVLQPDSRRSEQPEHGLRRRRRIRRSPSTAARRSTRSRAWATSTTTRSGSTR